MAHPTPSIVVLAGPNGAGKSTIADELLQGALHVDEFVNADVIAHGLSAYQPNRAALEAGAIMLERIHLLAEQRQTFAFETTLASRSFAPWIARLKPTGYLVHLIFLWLPSPENAIQRVIERVHAGGHDVPADTIRRRYDLGLRNFFRLYRPLVNTWQFYDNSLEQGPRVVAESDEGQTIVHDALLWQAIYRKYGI